MDLPTGIDLSPIKYKFVRKCGKLIMIFMKYWNLNFFSFCSNVIGFDIDKDALDICKANLDDFEITDADLIQTDVTSIDVTSTRWHKLFDTVIMNPPFGTKHNEGKFYHLMD